jgi:hypothetical protein
VTSVDPSVGSGTKLLSCVDVNSYSLTNEVKAGPLTYFLRSSRFNWSARSVGGPSLPETEAGVDAADAGGFLFRTVSALAFATASLCAGAGDLSGECAICGRSRCGGGGGGGSERM